jgi:RNA polymerase sigma-70 factor (ECF subfamily)
MTEYDEKAAREASIESLYLAQRAPLVAYLTRLVHDRAWAEDLYQETFLKAIRGWAGRDSTAATTAWLYRIATNTAYDHLRRRQASGATLNDLDRLPSRSAMPESELGATELVHQALARLPARYRMLLIMHICQGYALDEIADVLGCSYNAAKMCLCRARARFQQVYQS